MQRFSTHEPSSILNTEADENWWDKSDQGKGPLSFAPSAVPKSSSGSNNDTDQLTERNSSPAPSVKHKWTGMNRDYLQGSSPTTQTSTTRPDSPVSPSRSGTFDFRRRIDRQDHYTFDPSDRSMEPISILPGPFVEPSQAATGPSSDDQNTDRAFVPTINDAETQYTAPTFDDLVDSDGYLRTKLSEFMSGGFETGRFVTPIQPISTTGRMASKFRNVWSNTIGGQMQSTGLREASAYDGASYVNPETMGGRAWRYA